MKKLFGLLFALLICNVALADDADFRCFKSVGLKNTIRLQFSFPAEDQGLGHVRYVNGSAPIPVKKIGERTVSKVPGGRPWVFEMTWQEVGAQGGGKYIIVTQGVLIDEFRYVRQKDGKVFRFEDDPDATGKNGCEWKRQ